MRGCIKLIGESHESLLNTYSSSLVVESFNTYYTSNFGYSNTFFSGRESLYEILYYDNYLFINGSWMPGSRASNLAWNSTEALDARYPTSSKGLLTGRIGFLPANVNSKEYIAYYYDKKGRLVQQNGTNHFNPVSNYSYGYDHFNYAYDFKGNVLHKSHRQRGTFAGTILLEGTYHTYDPAGRLLQTSHYVNSGSPVVTSSNSYNELGQLSSRTIGNNLETQEYAYNIRGWLKSMKGKYFREALYYETTRSSTAGCYNGNISQSDIRYHAGDHNASLAAGEITPTSGGTPLQFNYTYDHLNRLTYAQTMGSSGQYNEQLSYDKHGNIASLDRVGIRQHNWINPYTPDHTISAIDDLDYTFDGNRVISISDNASMYDPMYTGSQDFKGGTSQTGEYAYDANGNMSSDLNKGIATIKYNFLNLPDTTQMVNGHMRACNYDASGDKILVYHRTVNSSGVTMQPGWTLFNHSTGYTITGTVITMYLDNVIYKDYNVDKLLDSDGILIRTNDYPETTPVFKRNYYIKDHLGNVRVVFDDTGIIKQVNNYYPFGMEYGESAQTATLPELTYQKFLFGGKELDREFQINTYDFEARSFDQTSGRFTTMDPLSEKYYSTSPYAYCGNNPIRFIDPTGNEYYEDMDKSISNFDKLFAGIKKMFSIKIDLESKESISESINVLESNQQEIKKTGDVLFQTSENISSVIPFGSTLLTATKALNGVTPTAGDVASSALDFASMAPLKIAGKVAKGGRAFFSGAGTEARAIEQGYQTLGQTRAGQNLQNLITSKNIPWEGVGNAESMWRRLSATWAKGIPNSSSVPVFLNNPRAGSVWFQTELPILQSKGVNLINK